MKTLNAETLNLAFKSGANAMANNEERINSMNVFPVPDGDTGSNMAATIVSADTDVSKMNFDNIGDLTSAFARGMLLGARGNSGVILSQIFKGFSEALKGKKEATSFDIVEAFNQARIYAYKSVMKPVEGTILSVIRETYEDLSKTITPSDEIDKVFNLAVKYARKACDATPESLPVLKEVGVTDSGGEGLWIILQGISFALAGNHVEKTIQKNLDTSEFIIGGGEDFNGEYGYCTEFIVELKNQKAFKKDKFSAALEKMANSIIVVQDEEILKVHLHTLKPGNIFNFSQKFGEFLKIKSENMTLQANESQNARKERENKKTSKDLSDEEINIGVVACNSGAGIINDMKDLGTDFVIQAGQTANPSASDFIEAIKSLNTKRIILLPNNSNIIMVAQQVASTSDKEIIVIPTKTQMAGLSAMMNFDRNASLDDNREAMEEAIGSVKTGQVTMSARTTKIEGVSVKKDEFLSIADRKIISSNKSKTQAAINICKNLIDDDTEIVTIYYGDDATSVDANDIVGYIENHYDVDVEIKEGKQPVYSFLIAFE